LAQGGLIFSTSNHTETMKTLWMMWQIWRAKRAMRRAHRALGRSIAAMRVPADWPVAKSYGPGRGESLPESVEEWLQQDTRPIV